MPIVVSNNPAQLIGDLAQGAGNFATGQAQNQMALQNAAFADRQRQGDEEMQLRRDQMAQQADLAKQHIQAQVMAHVLSSMSQQQLEAIRDKARLQQIAAQGGNQQTLAGINNASREGIASDRNDTTQRGQDMRSGYQYDALDQRRDQFDQNQQRQTDQFGQTYDQRNRGLDQRDTAQASTNFYRQQRNDERQQRDTLAGQQQERLAMGQKLDAAHTEARIWQNIIKNDPRNRNPETAVARARLAALGKIITELTNKVQNANLATTQPVVQTGTPFQPPPQMGTYAGDETPAYGGGAPMADQGGNYNKITTTRQIPAQTAPPVPPEALQMIQDMKGRGATREQIKAELYRLYGLTD